MDKARELQIGREPFAAVDGAKNGWEGKQGENPECNPRLPDRNGIGAPCLGGPREIGQRRPAVNESRSRAGQ